MKTRLSVEPCPVGLQHEQGKPLNRVSPSRVHWTQEGPRRSGLEGEAEPWGTPGRQSKDCRAGHLPTGIKPGLEATCQQTSVSKASNSPTSASAALSLKHSAPLPRLSRPRAPHLQPHRAGELLLVHGEHQEVGDARDESGREHSIALRIKYNALGGLQDPH